MATTGIFKKHMREGLREASVETGGDRHIASSREHGEQVRPACGGTRASGEKRSRCATRGVRMHSITEGRGGQGEWKRSAHGSNCGGAKTNGRSERDSRTLRKSADQYISNKKCTRAHRGSRNGHGGRAGGAGGAGGAGVVGDDGGDDGCDEDLAASVVRWSRVARIIVRLADHDHIQVWIRRWCPQLKGGGRSAPDGGGRASLWRGVWGPTNIFWCRGGGASRHGATQCQRMSVSAVHGRGWANADAVRQTVDV